MNWYLVYSQIVPDAVNTVEPSPSKWPSILLLIAGVVLGVTSGILAMLPNTGSGPVVFGAGAAIAAVALTFTIALQQNADTADLRQILFKIEEQTADKAYGPTADTEDSSDKPSYAAQVIDTLRARKANLNFDDLRWRRKVPSQPIPGNHGWFVESNSGGDGERWYVRKANGLKVRKAMPRDFLEALEDKANLDPREIKHDFQLTNHGLAAWYARTYSDELWKVSRSNRNASAGISVTRENPDN